MKSSKIGLLFYCLSFMAASCSHPESASAVPSKTEQPITSTAEITVTPTPQSIEEILPPVPSSSLNNVVFVYTNSQDLYIFSDGETKQLTNSGDVFHPRISPDGQLIAYLKPVDEIHLEIWCIDRDGSNERQLVSIEEMETIAGGVRDPSATAVNPSFDYNWLPGSRILAFTSQQIYQGPGTNLLNDLIVVDADTGVVSPLFLAGWGGQFAFSPDGAMVAITQPDKILLSKIDGSGYQTALTYDPVTTYSEYRYYASPVWSPDSGYLLVAIPPIDPLSIPIEMTEIWRINTNGSPAKLLGKVGAVPFIESEVHFSPDLNLMMYISGDLNSNMRELHIAGSDGSSDIAISQGSPIIFQAWASDLQFLAFSEGSELQTWIADAMGEKIRMGADFDRAHFLAWANDTGFIYWT